jgi:hypothetical protein
LSGRSPDREVLNTQGRPDRSKVFHVNLGRGREATELLQRMADEEKVDVVLIQESYCYMPTWAGWSKYGGGCSDKIATMVRTGRRSIELVCRAKHQDSDHRRGKRRHRVY